MEAKRLIEDAHFSPETLHVLFAAFDAAWEEIADHFGPSQEVRKRAGLQLAHAVLAVAGEEPHDIGELKRNALAVMALSYNSAKR